MKKYIGDRKFYKMVLAIAVPIIIQNGITNFVSLLDNIMVGRIGTEEMSGVAIVNQLIFVFNVSIFGAISGASIFGAQFFGNKNYKGMRDSYRFKFISVLLVTFISAFIFVIFGRNLISLYLHKGSTTGDIAKTLLFGEKYLRVMLWGLLPFAINQAYTSSLREMGQTLLPMASGLVAVLVNLAFNYVLIFGKLGFPVLGVEGAAIATVISRYVELSITVLWTHINSRDIPFIRGAYKTFRISKELTGKILLKGLPLMANEFFWSGGMATLTQCYSVRGLAVIGGLNIASTISNVFNVVFIALGGSISVIVGQLLGAGKMEEARDTDRKLIFFSVSMCVIIGLIMASLSSIFPSIYNTTREVKELASSFILIVSLCMPLHAFMHATYFTLRSGGKTLITFLFDSGYVWLFNIPLAFILTRYTSLNILVIYLSCQLIEIIKCIIGYVLVKKGVWLQNIVE
ncbi:MATE family efflux transporter [Alloiococcus sp. CFN-8]|uniref:MATE family efflux transporter n=1 Tax=Alloiococcus sp. CFN-8 TaxID=3416081 RepID=UPI003CE88D75